MAGDIAARNYRFDEAVTLTRARSRSSPATPGRLPTSACTCCAPATSRVRARCSKLVQDRGFDVVTYNLLQMMDTLDNFVTITDGDIVLRMHKDEAPVLQEYALALAKQALDHAGEALPVHAEGSDPHRDVSRSTTTSR